jgi:hypothetical protein
MKRIAFFLLLIGALFACKNDPPAETGAEETSATETRPITPPEGGPIAGPNKKPSMQTEKLLGYLTAGYWYVEAFIKINDPEANAANRGRWYQFAADGTFSSGRYKTAGAGGVWTYDPQNALIFLDAQNDEEDSEWKLQLASDGSIMIWVGTKRFEQNSIQVKLENYVELMSELPKLSN